MAKKRKNGEGTWGEKTVNGKVYRFYRDADGKYFYGKTDKEIKEKNKNGSKDKKSNEEKKGQLFGDYILIWLKSIKSGIELTTYNSYVDAINTRLINFSEYDLANVEMRALNDAMIQSYLNALAAKYSLNSIRKTYGLIKKCIRYAEVKKDIELLNLDVTVKMPSEANVAVKKKEISVPTVEDVNMICKEAWSHCKNGSRKYGNASLIAVFITYTGLRVSEAIGLQWKNVNMAKKEIIISQSLALVCEENEEHEKKYSHIKKGVKTADSKRVVPLQIRLLREDVEVDATSLGNGAGEQITTQEEDYFKEVEELWAENGAEDTFACNWEHSPQQSTQTQSQTSNNVLNTPPCINL